MYPGPLPQRRGIHPLILACLIIGLLVIGEVAYLVIKGGGPLRAQFEVAQGEEAFQSNDFKAAEERFSSALKRNPKSLDAREGLARVYEQTGRKREALKELGAIVRQDPKNADLRVQYAYALDVAQQYVDAESELREALKLDTNHTGANNNLAYLLAEQNRELKQALAMAQKATKNQPAAGYIWDTLGWVHYRMKDYKEAEYALRRALQFEVASQDAAHYHLGMTLARVKQLKEARAQLSLVNPRGEFSQPAAAALKALEAQRDVPDEFKPRINLSAT